MPPYDPQHDGQRRDDQDARPHGRDSLPRVQANRRILRFPRRQDLQGPLDRERGDSLAPHGLVREEEGEELLFVDSGVQGAGLVDSPGYVLPSSSSFLSDDSADDVLEQASTSTRRR